MSSQACDLHFKILLIGDSGVGARTFLNSFTDEVDDMQISSLDNVAKTRVIEFDRQRVRLHIRPIDFRESSTRRKSIHPGYFRGRITLGMVLMYDVTNLDSFNSIRLWKRGIDQVASAANVDVTKVLVGNKCDVPASKRVVSKEQGLALADEMCMPVVETSGKMNVRIEDVFTELAKDMKKQWDMSQQVLLAAKAQKDAERAQWVRQARMMLASFAAGCVLTLILCGQLLVSARQ